jgi:hypothetical protein
VWRRIGAMWGGGYRRRCTVRDLVNLDGHRYPLAASVGGNW